MELLLVLLREALLILVLQLPVAFVASIAMLIWKLESTYQRKLIEDGMVLYDPT